MASREHWEHKLHCQNCKSTGAVYTSEADDVSYLRNHDWKIDSVSNGFRATRTENANSFTATCLECGEMASQSGKTTL
jgi:hypothetical protein